ncbi:Hypothetical_protein [Hexamita inflata]|uniref:Hypothetical_protein n=1 Tax=Hexamita inflata TaxID=28002 RepID=A0ABP1H6Z3_9EUKA
MKLDQAKSLFVHVDGEFTYAYTDRQAHRCTPDLVVLESKPTSVSVQNEFAHRYPAFKQGNAFYATYRGNNKIFKLDKFIIKEFAGLSNLYPYCICSFGDQLLVTDDKGKLFYLLANEKLTRCQLKFDRVLSDIFLHSFDNITYLINREQCAVYQLNKDLNVFPIIQSQESNLNQISFCLNKFVLIGKTKVQHFLIDLQNKKVWKTKNWFDSLEGDKVTKYFKVDQITPELFEFFGPDCVLYYKQEAEYEKIINAVSRNVNEQMVVETNEETKEETNVEVEEDNEGEGKYVQTEMDLIAFLEMKFQLMQTAFEKKFDEQRAMIEKLQNK